MKIGQAIERGGPNGSIPNSNLDYMVGSIGSTKEPIKNKRGEIVEPNDAFRIYWWPEDGDLDARALEREFEVDLTESEVRVNWRAGDDDPSGPVTEFVQNSLAPELAAAIRGE